MPSRSPFDGIRAHTDRDKLTVERALQREEAAEINLAKGTKRSLPAGALDPNTASGDELMNLPGIGEVMAHRIIEGRPYTDIDNLKSVPGIGPKTFEKFRDYLRIEGE